ncbi:acyl-CoA dehydrogenase [Actinomadura sp. KC345]|uniref:acyl-CoA dehydrogenase n=1 Tax=Actinomadura sp. KC345 TaxID=2530371 RepID=UPI00104C5696|nr:acyl-CoA dehydrogenase [Actinomadura sp. KC345]TDC55487.1 acyl-CoA dehydrogenase [Actinomadura sp. KC345]
MSHLDELRSAADGVLADHLPDDAEPPAGLDRAAWDSLAGHGFTGLNAGVGIGGGGGTLADAAEVVEAAALVAVPAGEALFLAVPLLDLAGIKLPDGVLTAAAVAGGRIDAEGVHGEIRDVPWLASSDTVIVLSETGADAQVSVLAVEDFREHVEVVRDLAGQERGNAVLTGVAPAVSAPLPSGAWRRWFDERGALVRAVQIAAGMQSLVDQTTRHVQEREQFGRPLAALQAVQQRLAGIASHAVLTRVAARSALVRVQDGTGDASLAVATAKAEASHLVAPVCAAAHQLHGAIGFTREHRLGAITNRLWTWRDDHGGERVWWTRAGAAAQAAGTGAWALLAGV